MERRPGRLLPRRDESSQPCGCGATDGALGRLPASAHRRAVRGAGFISQLCKFVANIELTQHSTVLVAVLCHAQLVEAMSCAMTWKSCPRADMESSTRGGGA